MKYAFTLLLSIILTITLSAQVNTRFNFHTSELYATYDFIMKISNSYPDNKVKSLFLASPYATESYQKQIVDFEQLQLDYNYAFKQYPPTLKAGVMTRDIIERNLVMSATIDEFRSRSMGIIPNEDLSRLASILENFLPVYQGIIFEPYKAAFAVQKENLLPYVTNNQFSDYFQVGLSFYGTSWDSEVPIELNLLLSLDKGNLGARAFNNVAVCEASVGLKDHVSFFSVAMHEIFHIIYDNQSLAMKEDIQKWFTATGSPNSQYALLLMNEVLATALGNGYVIDHINGKPDEQEWYGNKYISEMAKAIYPVIKEYIKDKKTMDEAFIKAYVSIYDARFPQWGRELAHLLTYRYVVADTDEDWRYIRRTFRYSSYSRFSVPITPAEVEKANASPVTKMFIISQNHEETLKLLKATFKELIGKKPDYRKEFILVLELGDRTKLFIINRHQSSTEELMKKYFPKNIVE